MTLASARLARKGQPNHYERGREKVKKRVLVSVLAIALIASLVGAFTYAYFSDPETATATFSAGTVDIEVGANNPWNGSFTMADLKPSETGSITFNVKNVGMNKVVLWKHIGDIKTDGGLHPESEDASDPTDTINDIHKVIDYDLKVADTVIFDLKNGLSVDDIQSMWMPLGCLDVKDGTLVVEQSYHMQAEAGNEYQGDSITFDIDLYAEQLLGNGPTQLSNKLFLDNKTGETEWCFIADGMWGILTWGTSGDLYAQGLTVGTDYSLITYVDPWPSTGLQVIASGTSTDGTLSLSGFSMPKPYQGKIWLVLKNDVSGNEMVGWQPTLYLFESNKVNIP
jgi:predicted ribosomally synthesized peptide with SipW-like signal peptide